MPKSPKRVIVLNYLHSEFPDYYIIDNLDETGGYNYRLLKDEENHQITVQLAFLAEKGIYRISS